MSPLVDPPDAIEQLSIRLVQDAPDLAPAIVDELCAALQTIGSPLALTIARIVELVGEQLIDPAISLPAIAEACATCAAGVRGTVDERVLEAARYQIDTLTPLPDKPPRVAAPDVHVIDLVRRHPR